ncbi:MAG: glycosyltransferase [Candidatus Ryanbacteria bacterium CG10_big_fil_rev_8_21_14_0_10_43_42]|uniref:Glycosyltransferase n=1 Tax=Candidatus Ryanbacteria bacterium CG10_big_fil_rev_8_21_14_0_10_43_42 TaxID=1974864 RepID=A0A2M8KXF5_9BACT|nr:MAG: glycosyltransferase [Candidatus Ryanbacteria bacterium CG10_big_fil_rev_8_21_14_0_10_43_42]
MSEKIDKKISVVIPCYNEESNLPELYTRVTEVLASLAVQYEIIFTDNKSTDTTRKLLRDLAERDKHVKVLFFARNFGNSQYGYSAGSAYATGDVVIWMEADLQDPPEVIREFIKKWQEGFQIVYGVRSQTEGSFFSQLLRHAFYKVFKKLSYLDIPVDAGDFSLLDRKVIDIFNTMPERSRLVRGMRAWIGFQCAGVAYKRKKRAGGMTSNPNFIKNLWWAKKLIFSFSETPLTFITNITLWLVIMIPFFIIFMVLLVYIEIISWIMAFAFIVIMVILTLQTIALSFLGESMNIMFEEVKQRPLYVIEEKINF